MGYEILIRAIEVTVRNLDITITYLWKGRFNYYEVYNDAPFVIYYLPDHRQPVNVMFNISYLNDGFLNITAEEKKATFTNLNTNESTHRKVKWVFTRNIKLGELIETEDLAFKVEAETIQVKKLTKA